MIGHFNKRTNNSCNFFLNLGHRSPKPTAQVTKGVHLFMVYLLISLQITIIDVTITI